MQCFYQWDNHTPLNTTSPVLPFRTCSPAAFPFFCFFAFVHPKVHVQINMIGSFEKHIGATVAATTPVIPPSHIGRAFRHLPWVKAALYHSCNLGTAGPPQREAS